MFVMVSITTTRLFPRFKQVVQRHESERGNEKDLGCSKKMAERVPYPECVRVENFNNNKPKLDRDIDDRKEVLSSLTFFFFLKGLIEPPSRSEVRDP